MIPIEQIKETRTYGKQVSWSGIKLVLYMADPLFKLRLSFKKCLVSACCCNPVLRARDTLRKETWLLAWKNSNQGIVNAYWVAHVTREA